MSITVNRFKRLMPTTLYLKRNSGFSLLELLVALVIFALLATMTFRGIAQLATATQRINLDNRKWREVSLLIERLEEDISHAIDRPWRDQHGLVQPAFQGNNQSSNQYTPQLDLVRLENTQVIRLAYRHHQQRLEMLLWPPLEQAPLTPASIATLLENVASFELQFLDKQGHWRSQWPLSPHEGGLPKAVNIVLRLTSGEVIQRLLALPQ